MATTAIGLEVRTLPAFRAAVVTECCHLCEVGPVIGRALAEVLGALSAAGIDVTGAPFAAWSNVYEDGTAEAQIGWPVVASDREPLHALTFVDFRETRAVVHRHVGPYDGLPAVYAELDAALAAAGHEPAGPPREMYLTDPASVPDPQGWVTEIAWPIR